MSQLDTSGHARGGNPRPASWLMVGAIGFEPAAPQSFEALAGLGWQPKDRNGSQRNNYWTRIGHAAKSVIPTDRSISRPKHNKKGGDE